MNNNKQTAVEFLIDKFESNHAKFINWSDEYFEQAKQMEKEQIIKFTNDYLDDDADTTVEQYYNETFKSG